MRRVPEPEAMDGGDETEAYQQADFAVVNQAFVDRTVELASTPARARAIDMGTGPADIPARLIRARPAWRVVGVDASAAMLALARQPRSRPRDSRAILRSGVGPVEKVVLRVFAG